jgi:ribosomal protein S18 acetylase RimI-like enzyme
MIILAVVGVFQFIYKEKMMNIKNLQIVKTNQSEFRTYKEIQTLKQFMTDLQAHLSKLDPENLLIVPELYGSRYVEGRYFSSPTMNLIMFVAKIKTKIIGLIAAGDDVKNHLDAIGMRDEKAGRVLELIVDKKYRNQGIGGMLIKAVEEDFRALGYESMYVEAFAPNEEAVKFYLQNEYKPRSVELRKKL